MFSRTPRQRKDSLLVALGFEREKRKTAEARIQTLEEALLRFGAHDGHATGRIPTCAVAHGEPCSCGFARALAGKEDKHA